MSVSDLMTGLMVIFLFVAYLGVVSVIISALILSRILGIMDISEIGFKAVLLTWGSMVCGLCIIPGVLVKKMYKVTVSQLGLGKTCIIVTHRLTNYLRSFDEILVMSEGKLVETGTYDNLMEKRGQFYRLCNE